VDPTECSFEMVAVGPLFPEQVTMQSHCPVRDQVAAVEKALAASLRERGYRVVGLHHCSSELDPQLFAMVNQLIADEFPKHR
jgi:hypothetical protein